MAGNIGVEIAKWMERESKERLKIDLAQPGSIVPAKDMFDAAYKSKNISRR